MPFTRMAIPLCAIATGEGNVGKKQESESRRQVFMITGEIKSKVDRIWDTMWSGGISNPLSVIEQLTYLLFIKRLDELHTLKERKAARTGKPIKEPVFAADQAHLRWSRFKETAPETMFAAGGPDALFAGRENVMEGVFKTLESFSPDNQATAG
jgi:hypothetical protein